jgi:ribonuclease R
MRGKEIGTAGTLVGTAESNGQRWWLSPYDTKIAFDVDLQPVDGVEVGDYVVVRIDKPPRGRGSARGSVVEILGPLEEPGVDVLAVLRHHGIPEPLDEAAVAEAEKLPPNPGPEDLRRRTDLRDRVTVTIDGETARDFDDAISLERLPNGRVRLGVHIADVAHYVRPGSALDDEAYRRGTSVYYPERAIPMLPEKLSNGLCSLRPDVERLTLSVFLDVDNLGRIQRREFAETVIRSRRRLTYDEVRRVLEHPEPSDRESYGEVLPLLIEAQALMVALHRDRLARGSLDFDLPTGDVILDTDGATVGIRPGERHVAHRVIEELMIAANEAVAEELVTRDQPGIYRVHHPPDPERLGELQEILKPLGLVPKESPREKGGKVSPAYLQAILRKVADTPDEPFVSALVLRTQQRAVYKNRCEGHFALASEFYLHFTSPIRRYPDLVVHRQLKELIRGQQQSKEMRMGIEPRLEEVSEHCSITERRAEHSERELLQWKKVRFLSQRQGERFKGRITGVQPFGLFVQLDDLFVDGLVPVSKLGDDYYEYDGEGHRLVGSKSGTTFQLAQPVEVRLTGVDQRHRGLDLEILSGGHSGRRLQKTERKPKQGRRGRNRR